MHHAKAPGVDKQRHVVEPLHELAPFGGIVLELLEGFVDQPGMARRVLAHKLLATAGRRWRTPAQRVEFMVAHQAQGLTAAHHVVDNMQRLTNTRAAVNDVTQKHRHPLRVSPDTGEFAIAQTLQQVLKGMSTAMHVTDQIVTARRIEHQSALPPSRLPQPSLVRHTS